MGSLITEGINSWVLNCCCCCWWWWWWWLICTVQGTGSTRGLSLADEGCFTHQLGERISFIADFMSAADIRRLSYIHVYIYCVFHILVCYWSVLTILEIRYFVNVECSWLAECWIVVQYVMKISTNNCVIVELWAFDFWLLNEQY